MTLKVRIFPCLDVKDDRVVKGVNFVDLVDVGGPRARRLYCACHSRLLKNKNGAH